MTVKPSRATQNAAITCSKECLGILRSRNRIRHFGSSETRSATCAHCSKRFERKPSQLTKYAGNYCRRECATAAKLGSPNLAIRTGEYRPCETCKTPVWRTPATRQPHTYCSRLCAAQAPRGPRVARVAKPCGTCGTMMTLLPSDAARYTYCSCSCAARTVQGAKRGLPGRSWPPVQRLKLSATLLAKYQAEWISKPAEHGARMRGAGNPQWRDGSATRPYAPGFTDSLKRRIARRDGNVCRVCGVPKGTRTHAVHHIDGGKDNHDPSNLILLCASCHALIHHGKIELTSATRSR